MMSLEIRSYTKQDKESCLIAFKSNVPKYFGENEIPLFESFLDKDVEVMLSSERTKYYFVVKDDKVIGCGGFGNKIGAT